MAEAQNGQDASQLAAGAGAVEQPSLDAIEKAVKEIVSAPDFNPDTVSAKMVRKMLETKYFPGVDLTPRKKEVDKVLLDAVAAKLAGSSSSSSSSSSSAERGEPPKKKAKKDNGEAEAKSSDDEEEDKDRKKKKKKEKKPKKEKKSKKSKKGEEEEKEEKKRGKKRKHEETEDKPEDEQSSQKKEEEDEQLYTETGRPRRRAAEAQRQRSAKIQEKNRRLEEARQKRKSEGVKKPGKEVIVSDTLAAVVGAKRMGRNEVVSKLWEYIRANNLMSGKYVKCDEKLEAVFKKKQVHMFSTLPKVISRHMALPDELTPSSAAANASDDDDEESGNGSGSGSDEE